MGSATGLGLRFLPGWRMWRRSHRVGIKSILEFTIKIFYQLAISVEGEGVIEDGEGGVKEKSKGPNDKTHPPVLTANQPVLLCRMSALSTQKMRISRSILFNVFLKIQI